MTHTKDEALNRAQSAVSYTILALSNGNDLTYAKACLESALTAIKQAQTQPVQEPEHLQQGVDALVSAAGTALEVLEKHRQMKGEAPMGMLGVRAMEELKEAFRLLYPQDDYEPPAAPVPLTDDQIRGLMPKPDGVAEGNVRRVEVLPGVMGTEFDEVDAWSMPLVLQIARAIESAHGITKGQL